MLTKVNKYIKEQIKKLDTKDREEVIDFATFLRRQEETKIEYNHKLN